ncbi:MAG: class I SAM-dependent methyltransferase [Planctomycetes bacterium]|nr:class I SAM-dependent methyltransferase [Planctomycetota bacterium]
MEEAPCILCRKPGSPWFEKADKFPPHERFRVVRCPECGLGWVTPRPTPGEIGRYYPATYSGTAGAERSGAEGGRALLHRAERWYRFHLLRFETRQLLRRTDLAPGDAVLDVGCAGGERMLVMQQAGLAPAGVDIAAAADLARRRTGLDVRRGTLAEARFESGRFRAATLYNVLEHVHDPRGLLEELRRILAPRGWLAVQSPNAASLQARLFGRRWAALDAPRDLYYYTWRHLVRLLEGEGFGVTGVARRTSFLHPPTAAVSLAPALDPQRFWMAEAGGGTAGGLARRVGWAAVTAAVMPAVWLESALGACAIPTVFARMR